MHVMCYANHINGLRPVRIPDTRILRGKDCYCVYGELEDTHRVENTARLDGRFTGAVVDRDCPKNRSI